MAQVTELGRSQTQGFEICLRRRDGEGTSPVHELVVNGAFAMDSLDHSSEDALADCVPTTAGSVLVAGLGLGYTTLRLLGRCPHAMIVVVELSADLVAWARRGLSPELATIAASDRVRLVQADIADMLARPSARTAVPSPMPWDAILLDVDNGPDFLIHDHNDALYRAPALSQAAGLLAPQGLVAIWCHQTSAELDRVLARLPGERDTRLVIVQRGRHAIDYAIHCWWPEGRPGAQA